VIFINLDPGTSTGYSVYKIEDTTCTLLHYETIAIDNSSIFQGDHCIFFMRELDELYKKYQFEEVSIEDYFFSSRFANGSNVNYSLRAAAHIWARQNNLPYYILNISSWKVFIASRASPTKEQKKLWGKDLSKKIYIQESLWKKYKIRFPNHSISEKTGKPISFLYDVVDSVAQGFYHAHAQHNCTRFLSIVQPPEDVEIKGKKPQFKYI
jgi:Holliday junction resolvasome RuvABC endonuclease subunit